MKNNVRALILAAGPGSRLEPLTSGLPKPLLPVLDRPVICHVIDRLRNTGITEIAINTFHRGSDLEEALGDGSTHGVDITWFREPKPLHTGGALVHTYEYWRDSTLLVVVADMISTLDLGQFLRVHRASEAVVTVSSFEHPWAASEWHGGVVTADPVTGQVSDFEVRPGAAAKSRIGTTGTWVIDPAIAQYFPPDETFLLEDLVLDVAANGGLYTWTTDHVFEDFGTSAGFVEGTALALAGRLEISPAAPLVREHQYIAESALVAPTASIVGPVLIGDGAVVEAGAVIVGPTVIGRASTVGAGAAVRESVLFPGALVPAGSTVMGGVVGDAVRTPIEVRSAAADQPRSASGRQ